MLFDYMGILLDKQAMADYDFIVNVTLPDVEEQYMLRVKNGVILVYDNAQSGEADLSITCPKNALLLLLQGNSIFRRRSRIIILTLYSITIY